MDNIAKFKNNELGISSLTSIMMNGEPIFFPKEVGEILGYSDFSHSILTSSGMIKEIDYIKIEGKQMQDLKNLFRDRIGNTASRSLNNTKSIIVLTESGLNNAILRSTKPEAIKVRIWITNEVLPSIRKTGQYSIASVKNILPQEAAKRILKADIEIADLLGVPKHIGIIEAVKDVKKELGIDYSKLLQSSRYMDDIALEEEMLEPTELGKKYNISVIMTNKLLHEAGMQNKKNGTWIPSKVGEEYCMKHSWHRGKKNGYNLKWNALKCKRILGGK